MPRLLARGSEKAPRLSSNHPPENLAATNSGGSSGKTGWKRDVELRRDADRDRRPTGLILQPTIPGEIKKLPQTGPPFFREEPARHRALARLFLSPGDGCGICGN